MLEVRDRLNFEDYLDSLLNSVESDDLEFKSAAGGFPGSFWDTYSAFANSEGGVIVLGVIERKGKFYIDNLSDEQIEKYTKDFWNNVNNRATVSCNLLKTEDVVVEDYNGHKLMLFFMKDNIRRDDPPAHIAVREALVNLCIHTDYSADATMVVRLFPDDSAVSVPSVAV
jgi:ATP-dependent DNA helicase RecG